MLSNALIAALRSIEVSAVDSSIIRMAELEYCSMSFRKRLLCMNTDIADAQEFCFLSFLAAIVVNVAMAFVNPSSVFIISPNEREQHICFFSVSSGVISTHGSPFSSRHVLSVVILNSLCMVLYGISAKSRAVMTPVAGSFFPSLRPIPHTFSIGVSDSALRRLLSSSIRHTHL